MRTVERWRQALSGFHAQTLEIFDQTLEIFEAREIEFRQWTSSDASSRLLRPFTHISGFQPRAAMNQAPFRTASHHKDADR
jgi:hypothetical protein